MREIRQRAAFKSDLRHGLKGIYRKILKPDGEFQAVVNALRHDIPLPARYRDHPLHGEWEGSRDCHIRPDLVLVYRLEGEDLLILERLGSHSDIFGL